MDANIVDKFVESRNIAAAKASEIIARRVDRVVTRRFLWLSLLPPFIWTRLFRLRALHRKAGEFLPKSCCCGCHK